jgi:Recombination enhancement, RecA-dependent nuclease
MTSKRDLARFDKLQRIGCIACRQLGFYAPADVHHVLTGGRRTGHQDTIPLCPYHHRGVCFVNNGVDMGPSLANGSKPFHARFGTQAKLLAQVNKMLEPIKPYTQTGLNEGPYLPKVKA